MRRNNLLTGIVVGIVLGVLFSASIVLAGSLEPSGGPTAAGSQMYTLEQIYDRLNTGAAATKNPTFTDPSSGPTVGTMHTLDEIMGKAPVANANGASVGDVVAGKTFWGLRSGEWGPRTGVGHQKGICLLNGGLSRSSERGCFGRISCLYGGRCS